MAEKTLLKIEEDDNGIMVQCSIDAESFGYLCIHLAKLFKDYPELWLGVDKAYEMLESDSDFEKKIEEHTINIKNADFLS